MDNVLFVELKTSVGVTRVTTASVSGLIEPDFGSRVGATSRGERIKVTLTVQVTERDDDLAGTTKGPVSVATQLDLP